MGNGFSTISFPVKDFNDESHFVVDTGKAVVSELYEISIAMNRAREPRPYDSFGWSVNSI